MKSLQRTVRRCTALVVVLLSLLLYAVTRYLQSPYGASANLDVLEISQWVGTVFLLGAVGYLGLSVLASLAGEETDTPETEPETGAEA